MVGKLRVTAFHIAPGAAGTRISRQNVKSQSSYPPLALHVATGIRMRAGQVHVVELGRLRGEDEPAVVSVLIPPHWWLACRTATFC